MDVLFSRRWWKEGEKERGRREGGENERWRREGEREERRRDGGEKERWTRKKQKLMEGGREDLQDLNSISREGGGDER